MALRETCLKAALACLAVLTAVVMGRSEVQADSLQSLVGGGSLTVGDVVFDNWSVTVGPGLNLNNIDVSALGDQALNPGLEYNANGEWATTTSTSFAFEFTVATLDASARIKDNSLVLDAYQIQGVLGLLSVTERVGDNDSSELAFKQVSVVKSPGNLFENLTDAAIFLAQPVIFVETTINVSGFGSVASVDTFTQRFSLNSGEVPIIPLPAAVWVGLSLLGGLGVARRFLART